METLYTYEQHLFTIGVWPMELVFLKESISQILTRLKAFSFEPKARMCETCRHPSVSNAIFIFERAQNYKEHIKLVIKHVSEYFDGLCLDCLDRSQPKTGSTHSYYWRHASLNQKEWCKGCRVKHKQPTWYFSFMGRHDVRESKMQAAREEKYDDWYRSD